MTQTHSRRPLGRPPRSPLPQQTLHKVHPASTLSDRVKADQLHQRIRQKIVNNEEQQASGSHKLQENIGNIRCKIDKLDQVMRELQTGKEPEQQQRARSYEKIKRRFEEDNFSSSSSDEEEELMVTAIPQQRTQQKEEMRAVETVQMRPVESVQQFGRRIVHEPSSAEEQ